MIVDFKEVEIRKLIVLVDRARAEEAAKKVTGEFGDTTKLARLTQLDEIMDKLEIALGEMLTLL